MQDEEQGGAQGGAEARCGAEQPTRGRFTHYEGAGGLLGPIEGLFDDETNPLVSLSASARHFPFDFAAHVWLARQFAKKKQTRLLVAQHQGLSADHAAAIWCYTLETPPQAPLHRLLNDALRGRDRTQLKRCYFPFLRLLVSGLRLLATGATRCVSRGVTGDAHVAAARRGDYEEGQSVVWWGVSSCTSDTSALSHSEILGNHTVFRATTTKGVDISAFSADGAQGEVLLPPGTTMLVERVLPKDHSGLVVVLCRDDNDAPCLVT